MTTTRTITRRSRNLGFGFSNQMARTGPDESPRIERPAGPSVTGNWRDIVDAYQKALRTHGPTEFRTRLYVDGSEVLDLTVGEFVGLIQSPGQELTVTVVGSNDA
jgi:hypothetical protein